MNIRQIRQILKDTDFIHTSGTPEERRVAEYLAERCRELGAETRLEAFPVDRGHNDLNAVRTALKLLQTDGRSRARAINAAAAAPWRRSCAICPIRTRRP